MIEDLTDSLVNAHYVVEYEIISTGYTDNMVEVNSAMHHICVNRLVLVHQRNWTSED